MIPATLCYVQTEDHTLMLHRIKRKDDVHAGKWNGLGGKFEAGESPEECVIREIREEAGLRIRDPELRGVLTFPLFSHDQDWYVFVFVARDFTGELGTTPEGELAWIPNDELLQLNLWEGDKYFLKHLTDGRFFSGKFIYREKRLIDYQLKLY